MITCDKQHQQQPAGAKIKPLFFLYIYTILFYFIKVPKEVLLAALGNFLGGCLYVSGYSRSFFWSQHIPLSTFLPVGKKLARCFHDLAF
jgi:hypothetical protein